MLPPPLLLLLLVINLLRYSPHQRSYLLQLCQVYAIAAIPRAPADGLIQIGGMALASRLSPGGGGLKANNVRSARQPHEEARHCRQCTRKTVVV